MAGFKEVLSKYANEKITETNIGRIISKIEQDVDHNVGRGISKEYADKVHNVIMPDMNAKTLASMIRNAAYNKTTTWTNRKYNRPKKTAEEDQQ